MRAISFFSRFTFICNIAFLLFIIFSRLESKKPASANARDTVDAIPFFKDLVITLGFSAIVINLLMCIIYVILLAAKRHLLPKWIPLVNFIFLIVQFYFFFF